MTKREKIIQSAVQLLAKNGIHATPMSAIAKFANTGMGTIYNYFKNKEVLINSIYVEIKTEEAETMPMFDNKKPIKTQLEVYYLSVINFFISHPEYFMFMDQLQASPMITAESKQVGYDAIAPIIELIKKGQEQRIIKDINLDEILQFLGGSVLSYIRWYLSENKNNSKTSLDNQIKMIWDAIKE